MKVKAMNKKRFKDLFIIWIKYIFARLKNNLLIESEYYGVRGKFQH